MISPEQLTLARPAPAFEAEYQAMIAEFLATDEAPFNDFELAMSDFPAFLRDLANEARGIGLPSGVVPQQTYWLVKDGVTILGEIRFRPHLTPPFERHNGHIGYNIRPSQRRHGYATRQLALLLNEARHQGLSRVMLPVECDNPASIRVIEKNGGALDYRHTDPETSETLSVYWIGL